MAQVRRTFMTEPGEPLVVSPSPVIAAIRFGNWTEFTGIDPSSSLITPMSSVPLPRYQQHYGPGQRRWPGTRAEAMWHPLMWLPTRLAARYTLENTDGTREVESDDLWAVRVGYEMTASGLYDEDSATWLDVLSLIGIDVANTDDLARVQAWLNGGDDEELEELDLSPLLDALIAETGDEDWSLHLAERDISNLRMISWACSADALLDHCEEIAVDGPGDMGQLRQAAGILADLAGVAFARAPSRNDPTLADTNAAEATWWMQTSTYIQGFTGSPDQLLVSRV